MGENPRSGARGKTGGGSTTTRSRANGSGNGKSKRAYVLQADVPALSLKDGLRVPKAIGEHFAFRATTPLNIAAALQMQPNSGQFRTLCGAALAYGLTTGGPQADEIGLTPLGLRIVRPTAEGDDTLAMREALLKPRIVGEFLRKYNNAPLPRDDIGVNVLTELGVARDRAADVQALIIQGAEAVGILKEIKGKRYVDLQSAALASIPRASGEFQVEEEDPEEVDSGDQLQATVEAPRLLPAGGTSTPTDSTTRRVFITHGKNRAFLDPIRKLLGFGEMQPVVSTDTTSVSQPVPDKVMHEMRSCGAAIIHVDAEMTLMDSEANQHVVLNSNVLIEIGAAIALYGRRFILLVKEGVTLPSNLQGLFEVRYSGDALDGAATIKLLEAINDIKNHPLPDRYSTPTGK